MEIILTSILAFAFTNLDDIFLLTLFFGDKRYKTSDVYIGQFAGVILLIGVSLAGSLSGNFIDNRYIGLLGLFPIFLGLRQMITLLKGGDKGEETQELAIKKLKAGIVNVAAVTFANGGDNIGVYIPLFTPLTTSGKTIMISIFLAMIGIWLAVAKYLTSHPVLAKVLSRYGHIITPLVLCSLGLFILKENDSFSLF